MLGSTGQPFLASKLCLDGVGLSSRLPLANPFPTLQRDEVR